jgi:hypothetical protein
MMWREERIIGGNMKAAYNPWRIVENEKECA